MEDGDRAREGEAAQRRPKESPAAEEKLKDIDPDKLSPKKALELLCKLKKDAGL